MADEKYNGWTNRETWAAYLYIANDEGMYAEGRDLAKADDHNDGCCLENWFQCLVEDSVEGGPEFVQMRKMLFDIGSLWRVNWREIQEALTEE